jgi:hypothetical protein
MPTTRFRQDKTRASKDMKDLQLRLGGRLGQVSFGSQALDVLQIRDNLYATDQKIPQAMKVALNLDQSDIHQVRTPGEQTYLLERVKADAKRA